MTVMEDNLAHQERGKPRTSVQPSQERCADDLVLLERLYEQVFQVMQERAALRARLRDAERRAEDLDSHLVLQDRRDKRRRRKLLAGIADCLDELDAAASAPGSEPEVASTQSDEVSAFRLAHHQASSALETPLHRCHELLLAEGVAQQHAEVLAQIDHGRFEVAAVVQDTTAQPGMVVRAHRPCYITESGEVVRKGAAIVATRVDVIERVDVPGTDFGAGPAGSSADNT